MRFAFAFAFAHVRCISDLYNRRMRKAAYGMADLLACQGTKYLIALIEFRIFLTIFNEILIAYVTVCSARFVIISVVLFIYLHFFVVLLCVWCYVCVYVVLSFGWLVCSFLFVLGHCQSTIIIQSDRATYIYKTCLMMLYPTSFDIQRFALLNRHITYTYIHKYTNEMFHSSCILNVFMPNV